MFFFHADEHLEFTLVIDGVVRKHCMIVRCFNHLFDFGQTA
jgi:hypothetical protein